MGCASDPESVSEDQIEHIHKYPDGSPVITNEEDRSSTIAGPRHFSLLLRHSLLDLSRAMLSGGKSPLLRFSSKGSRLDFERVLGRMLQLEIINQLYFIVLPDKALTGRR
jgi:hypothetical protein